MQAYSTLVQVLSTFTIRLAPIFTSTMHDSNRSLEKPLMANRPALKAKELIRIGSSLHTHEVFHGVSRAAGPK